MSHCEDQITMLLLLMIVNKENCNRINCNYNNDNVNDNTVLMPTVNNNNNKPTTVLTIKMKQ